MRRGDEGREGAMRLGLGHPMEIKACLDPVQTALQPFGIGTVDPGKLIERRQVRRCRADSLSSRRSGGRLAGRHRRIGRPSAAQRPNVANRFSP
jgi:hypothetical protein